MSPRKDLPPQRGTYVLCEGENGLAHGQRLVRIAAVGDVALVSRVGARIQQEAPGYPFRLIKTLLSESDVRFGNLEYPLTRSPRRNPLVEHRTRCAPPEAAAALADAGFTLLSIANNHIFDCLEEGLAETVTLLRRHGIGCVGAGSSLAAARAPAISVVNGVRLGFLAYTFRVYQIATKDTPGCAPNDPAMMLEDVRCLKSACDHVFVSIHEGEEFDCYPSPQRQQTARALVDAGAATVLYHHTHVPQGLEVYRGAVIAYGLGNLLCDIHDSYFQNSRSAVRYGMVVRLNLDASQLVSFELEPTLITADLEVQPMAGAERIAFFEMMNAISQPLYQPVTLKQLRPNRTLTAKLARLAAKARAHGLRALAAELGSDAKAQLYRRLVQPWRVRGVLRTLRESRHEIQPNPIPGTESPARGRSA